MKKSLIALGLVAIAAAPVAALADVPCGDGGACSFNLDYAKRGENIIKVDIKNGNKPAVTIRDFSSKATTLTCDVAIPGYDNPAPSFSFSNPGTTFHGGQGRGKPAQYEHIAFTAHKGGMVTDISQDSGSLLTHGIPGDVHYIEIANCQANASVSK